MMAIALYEATVDEEDERSIYTGKEKSPQNPARGRGGLGERWCFCGVTKCRTVECWQRMLPYGHGGFVDRLGIEMQDGVFHKGVHESLPICDAATDARGEDDKGAVKAEQR